MAPFPSSGRSAAATEKETKQRPVETETAVSRPPLYPSEDHGRNPGVNCYDSGMAARFPRGVRRARPPPDRRLCITGWRKGRLDVEYWLDRWVRKYGAPSLVIVGDSDDWTPWLGVDGQARVWALSRGFTVEHVRCITVLRSPERFHERNDRMVSFLRAGRDWCLAFPAPYTDRRGSGTLSTLRKARERGAFAVKVPSAARKVEAALGVREGV